MEKKARAAIYVLVIAILGVVLVRLVLPGDMGGFFPGAQNTYAGYSGESEGNLSAIEIASGDTDNAPAIEGGYAITWIVPPQYDDVRPFSEGLAAVMVDGLWGYIDTSGREVIPPRFDAAAPFSEGFAPVKTGNLWGFIDTEGRELVPPRYNAARVFSNGLAAVMIYCERGWDEQWGFVDTSGREVIPLQYDRVWDFSEGFATVIGYRLYVINTDGTEAFPIEIYYPRLGFTAAVLPFSEGFAQVWQVVGERTFYADGWDAMYIYSFGFIDTTGRIVIPPMFQGAGPFSGGLAVVVTDDWKYGFIDATGNMVVPPRYDQVGSFVNGLAWVVLEDLGSGLIDRTGREVVPLGGWIPLPVSEELVMVFTLLTDFHDIYDVQSVDPWHYGSPMRIEGLWGLVDTDGNEVAPLHYNWGVMWPFYGNIVAASDEGLWGFIRIDH